MKMNEKERQMLKEHNEILYARLDGHLMEAKEYIRKAMGQLLYISRELEDFRDFPKEPEDVVSQQDHP